MPAEHVHAIFLLHVCRALRLLTACWLHGASFRCFLKGIAPLRALFGGRGGVARAIVRGEQDSVQSRDAVDHGT
jgi:hypothetical protein